MATLRRAKRPSSLPLGFGLLSGHTPGVPTDGRAGKDLETIAQHFGAWSVSYNKWTGPLEKKAAELPELTWSPVER